MSYQSTPNVRFPPKTDITFARFMIEMLFVCALDATADGGNDYPLGSRQKLVVIVRANSVEDAIAEALIALTNKHWRDGELEQIQPFDIDPLSLEDPIIREAAMRAEQGHRSIIVTGQR